MSIGAGIGSATGVLWGHSPMGPFYSIVLLIVGCIIIFVHAGTVRGRSLAVGLFIFGAYTIYRRMML